MIAASTNSIPYGILLAVHVLLALASLVTLTVLTMSARAVVKGASAAEQAKRFPGTTNWSLRLFYLIPVTGMAMSGIGDKTVSLSQPWVGIGLLLWILGAGHLEARIIPSERKLAAVIAAEGTAPVAQAKKFALSVDVLLGLIYAAIIVMVWQP